MKRAKIMLMAIAVFGVVGGALAFKSSKFFSGTFYICTTTTNATTQLYCTAPGVTTVNNGIPLVGVKTVYASTTSPLGTCPHTVGARTIYCTTPIALQAFSQAGE
ncbi:MAG TPA: hypothetical protein VHE34_09795 [Puia sp.]|uniref:hypothetical protein n=1 Tax=Puia sp. TaxID=2045100 RepID=UPI002BDB018C|nr:hypothetical protein [Puia sp.]HVU95507.1 hypothetical protein [Puia sp.]